MSLFLLKSKLYKFNLTVILFAYYMAMGWFMETILKAGIAFSQAFYNL